MTTVSREDVLILLADGSSDSYPLDPVRLMKGAFLVERLGKSEWVAAVPARGTAP